MSKKAEKTELEKKKEELLCKRENGVVKAGEKQVEKADAFCEPYKKFLDAAKTEREATAYAVKAAEQAGFVPFDCKGKYKAGDKVYYVNRGKAVILAVIGQKKCTKGVRIAAAHIDSPRLDLKPNPLYEQNELAFFKTHYYGGIKKYQWTAIPLAIHGKVVKRDGSSVDVNLGEDPGDPQFCVTDLLPHLAREQMSKTLQKGIAGENLNILVGSRPFGDGEGGDAVKLNVMAALNKKYGMVEQDFLSAELELVPAFHASDLGFDRSMIGAYGHDDRVCAYTALRAVLDVEEPELTAVTILTDKEETGSDGNTGLQSAYLENFIADLARMEGAQARDVLRRSSCLSADVNAAFDPTYSSVYDPYNSAYLNGGVVVTKYTGAGGKGDTSDASAEFMGQVRAMMEENNIVWQTGELGKVDEGGGGTVAKYIANLDVDVVDVGVPVLSMHAPFEVVSKLDVYMTYRAFLAFFQQ